MPVVPINPIPIVAGPPATAQPVTIAQFDLSPGMRRAGVSFAIQNKDPGFGVTITVQINDGNAMQPYIFSDHLPPSTTQSYDLYFGALQGQPVAAPVGSMAQLKSPTMLLIPREVSTTADGKGRTDPDEGRQIASQMSAAADPGGTLNVIVYARAYQW